MTTLASLYKEESVDWIEIEDKSHNGPFTVDW